MVTKILWPGICSFFKWSQIFLSLGKHLPWIFFWHALSWIFVTRCIDSLKPCKDALEAELNSMRVGLKLAIEHSHSTIMVHQIVWRLSMLSLMHLWINQLMAIWFRTLSFTWCELLFYFIVSCRLPSLLFYPFWHYLFLCIRLLHRIFHCPNA